METSQYLTADFWESEEVEVMGGDPSHFPLSILKELPKGAVLFQTSGSSGVEKWVVHSRGSLLASATTVNAHFQASSSDLFSLLLPTFHVGGFGILARAYESGASCVFYEEKWNPKKVTELLYKDGVTITSMVPTQIYDLVELGLHAPEPLRVVIVGGGALPLALGQRARDLGWKVVQSYGMTETASQVATDSISSISKPFSNTHLPILKCWDVSLSVKGALMVSGAPLAKAVLRKEAHGWVMHETGEEWETQDRVALADGKLSFIGRIDRVIKIKGELVDLDALECSIGKECDTEVVLLTSAHERDGRSIIVISQEKLELKKVEKVMPPFVKISTFKVLSEIPKTPLGKVDRKAIRCFLDD